MAPSDSNRVGPDLAPMPESSGSLALIPTAFTISPRDIAGLNDIAREMQISRSAIVRQAIRQYLTTRQASTI